MPARSFRGGNGLVPASQFYPPRATRIGVLLASWAARARAARARRRPVSPDVPPLHLLGALLIPGLGFWLRRPCFWTGLALWGAVGCGLAFIVWLGRPPANLAFGVLMSIHSSALLYLCEPWVAGRSFAYRMGASLVAMGLVAAAVDFPARSFLQRHWFMPLQIRGKVVIIRCDRFPPRKRGEWIAYSLAGSYGHYIYLQDGYGLRPAWGLPGDEIRFSAHGPIVNGSQFHYSPHMPSGGSSVVPARHFFAWPEFDISGHGNIAESDISAMLSKIAMVSQDNVIGRPYKHWFWWKQVWDR